MNCWELLGIAPTTSTLAIKKAYTTLLRSCNPEDKPQEFKELRKAYQAALKESRKVDSKDLDLQNYSADNKQGEVQSNSESSASQASIKEIELLVQAMTDLYSDISRRSSLEAWGTLLNEPIFWDIDLSLSVKLATIEFFVNNPCLNANVLYLADQKLNFGDEHANLMRSEHRSLAEQFTVILNTAHLRFDHAIFSGVSCDFSELDEHLKLRRRFEDILIFGDFDLADLEALLVARDKRFEFDVLLDQSLAKQYLNNNQADKANDLLDSLSDKYMTADVFNMLAGIKFKNDDIAGAHRDYRYALSLEPENIAAIKGTGLCFYKEQQHEIAINILEELEERAFSDIELKTYLTKARFERFQALEKCASPNNLVERAELLLGLERYKQCYWLFGELPEEIKGFKRFFSKQEKEPENVRLLRARSSAHFGYKPYAAEVYCSVIEERLNRKENIIDVLKELLVFCCYKLTAEQVKKWVVDHLDDLTTAAQANAQLDPDYWLAVGLGHFRVTRKLTLNDEERRKHDQSTIFAFNQLVAIRPHSADYHLERGYVFVFIKQYEQSIVSNRIAAKSYMYTQGINRSIGKAYRHLKQFEQALESFNVEMSLCNNDKQRSTVYEEIAHTHYDMQDYRKAVKAFNTYRTLSKTSYIEDTMFMSKLCFFMEQADQDRESFSENLMAWHEDAIEAAQKNEAFNERYLNSPDFIQTLERIVVIAEKSFPSKLGPYKRFLNKIG